MAKTAGRKHLGPALPAACCPLGPRAALGFWGGSILIPEHPARFLLLPHDALLSKEPAQTRKMSTGEAGDIFWGLHPGLWDWAVPGAWPCCVSPRAAHRQRPRQPPFVVLFLKHQSRAPLGLLEICLCPLPLSAAAKSPAQFQTSQS